MKKRTILSLSLAAILFAAIAFQLHNEAISKTEDTLPRVVVYSVDSVDHGEYTAELVNLTTHQITILGRNRKIGSYPAVFTGPREGGGGNSSDRYIVHVCLGPAPQSLAWGVNSLIFNLPYPRDIILTAGSGCPPYTF